ncbi:DNA (cytosine-5-)-methyltransferase, partial [Candidatus Poribacteria bacterium]|nr:DNA (cytosine-5-)-methyltransferase [Candidatus Poribacteria bacterium]
DIERPCFETLRFNLPKWNVVLADIRDLAETEFFQPGADLVAGGLPCPPFSVAGKQLGPGDERDLFPPALRIIERVRPRAVMIENVRGFLESPFESYRTEIRTRLSALGYRTDWRLLSASDYGVPQLRPRVVIVALREELWRGFEWPRPIGIPLKTVGETLGDLMSARGWKGAAAWKKKANGIAPTIVGGSTKHGGPDLGPTRAKRAWEELGVNAHLVAEEAPGPEFDGAPHLTVRMVARLQGFPDSWEFSGRKTAAYRQVGNAFPPPVARAVAMSIARCLAAGRAVKVAV